ncbi:MAG: hypothetical protein M3220_07625 [Chloroflexota bacterium]|nr:hypothetical protein [Chloroflexota bacterium]
MDINQASQMISWLDEEHRRDKALLTELRQKVESQAVEIADQHKRVQELEARLTATQAKLVRFNTVEQAIQNVRDELVMMIKEQEEDLARYQREQVNSRQVEQESISRAINELRRNLEVIAPLKERITTLKAEDQRLGELTMNLQTRLIAHERRIAQLPDRISYVEGQRAQDVKAVAQVQEEVVELMRRTETLGSKQTLVEDIALKNEQRLNSLSMVREELNKRQAELAEHVRLKEANVDRQMRDWQDTVSRFEEEMGKQRKQLERFAYKQEEAQQYLVGIEEYKEALNRDQKQVAEQQRMAEERQRRELEEWITAEEQRWTRFRLEYEAQWHRHESWSEEVMNRLKQLEAVREEDLGRIRQINKELLVMREEYRSKLRELWAVHEQVAIFHLDEARRWYDEISAVVAEKNGNS